MSDLASGSNGGEDTKPAEDGKLATDTDTTSAPPSSTDSASNGSTDALSGSVVSGGLSDAS